jgi:hypothetical protein
MKEGNSYVRWIAGLVLLAFTWIALGLAAEMPLGAMTGRTGDKTSEARLDQPVGGESGVLEKTGTAPAIAKKKKFPWLLAAAGVAVAGVAVYFLFIHEPKQILDIRGKWQVQFYHGTFSMVAQFSGTLTAGTVSITDGFLKGEAGTYLVSGDQVSFDIPARNSYYVYKYQGRFDTPDSLSGTYFVESDPPGSPSDFTAVRIE